MEGVQKQFVACSRCSYFLAGYRVIHGSAGLESAVAGSDGEWLVLEWNEETRHLVQKSYGCQIDMEWQQFSACCPFCNRRFDITYTDQEENQPEPAGAHPEAERAETAVEDPAAESEEPGSHMPESAVPESPDLENTDSENSESVSTGSEFAEVETGETEVALETERALETDRVNGRPKQFRMQLFQT